MVIADESTVPEGIEIDLKCAEKVTDSDIEDTNCEADDSNKIKVCFSFWFSVFLVFEFFDNFFFVCLDF